MHITFLNPTLDRDLLVKIGEQIRINTKTEFWIGDDFNVRYPAAGN